jgi:hypothetical protein
VSDLQRYTEKMDKLEEHWQYAFSRTVYCLNKLAKEFDFAKKAGGQTCSVSNPRKIIAIIDAFLPQRCKRF